MKSRAKLLTNYNGGRPLNIDSKAKIYVPISIANQNREVTQQDVVQITPDHTAISELRKANLEFKQKQEIYIDKLIKLEEGLEKQHLQFRQLQDLYNQLLNSYKHKQEEISELQQKYRESNRKKQNVYGVPPPSKNPEPQFRKQDDQKLLVEKLQTQLAMHKSKINDLAKTVQRLLSENSYYKNKDKMNDSRASLNSKVFEELGQWQKQADIQKEEKIKLDYENKFLKSRNFDLQARVTELEQLLLQKQSQTLKLRQNNIILSRENSESRILRSISRSPQKSDEKQKSGWREEKNTKKNAVIDQLYEENKMLRKQLQIQRTKRAEISISKNEYFIKQEQFYSFSQDDHSNHSSNQEGQEKNLHKQLFIKVENNFEILRKEEEPNFGETLSHGNESLQQLPAELDIDNLISRNKKKNELEEA